jgi:HD-GYP domain-containing protein (c-di-GMP phosphodiesterase class II)
MQAVDSAAKLDPANASIHDQVDAALPREMRSNVDLLIRVVSAFDLATAQHLEAVGVFAMHLALEIGFDHYQAAITKVAGRVHDVGKLSISRSILGKPGPLTSNEWREIRLAPHYGAKTLEGLPLLGVLAPIVQAHHERIDGKGYPGGLRWDEIPAESQVIAIADAFHAMTSPRPYANARLPGDALTEMLTGAGTQFNERYLYAFINLIERGGIMRPSGAAVAS